MVPSALQARLRVTEFSSALISAGTATKPIRSISCWLTVPRSSSESGVIRVSLASGVGGARDLLEEALYDFVGVHAVGFGVEVDQEAVAKYGQRHFHHVFGGSIVAAIERRAG